MVALYFSIPLMILALAIATLPLVSAMIRDDKQRRQELEGARIATLGRTPAGRGPEPLDAAA